MLNQKKKEKRKRQAPQQQQEQKHLLAHETIILPVRFPGKNTQEYLDVVTLQEKIFFLLIAASPSKENYLLMTIRMIIHPFPAQSKPL